MPVAEQEGIDQLEELAEHRDRLRGYTGRIEKLNPSDRAILRGLLSDSTSREQLRRDPDIVRASIAETSLHEFIRQFWDPYIVQGVQFKDNWHIQVMCEHLEAVSRFEIPKLIINIPPRHQKSITVGVAWCAWHWVRNPQHQFLHASYAQNLSDRDSVACRRLIQSPLYQDRWGSRYSLTTDQNTKRRFDNDHLGRRLATSVGGQLTGEGGDFIVIDDAHNTADPSAVKREAAIEWWRSAMVSRLNDPARGGYVIIGQRVHERDLPGYLMEHEDDWTVVCLPARYEPLHPHVFDMDPRRPGGPLDYRKHGGLIWPDRYSEAALKTLELSMGIYTSAGQLQQRPTPGEGGLFDKNNWEYLDARPTYPRRFARGWDLGSTVEGNPTVGVLMSWAPGKPYVIEDVERFNLSPAKTDEKIKAVAKRDGKRVTIDFPQDPGAAGKKQVMYFRRMLPGYVVRSSIESGSKTAQKDENRAYALSSQQEGGNVQLIRGAPWVDPFIEEAELYPNASQDDQIDAAVRAFNQLLTQQKRRTGMGAFGAPEVIGG